MGFGLKWRHWIRCCISTPSLSVLINGSPTEEFLVERGLRQGDPLSPFLFNIVVQSLSCCLEKASVLNLIRGASLGGVLPKTLRDIRGVFFWGDGVEKRKLHAVDWETVCKSKRKGGLGIGRILDKNKGLLAKWVWRIGKKLGTLWRKVICAKYGVQPSNLLWNWNVPSSASPFAKAVSSLFHEESLSAKILAEGLKVVVGNGDRWLFRESLLCRFKKRGAINEFGLWQGEEWVWNVKLRRAVFDWESVQWKSFILTLNTTSVRRVWVKLFSAVVWTIWEATNQVIFRDKHADSVYYVDLVRFRVAWWFKHLGKGSSESITLILENLKNCCVDVNLSKPLKRSSWVPPLNEALKFNVDGAARIEEGRVGIGGILRNSKGVALCSFSAFIGKSDAISVELWAIHNACYLCLMKASFFGRNIQIVSDSRIAVAWVNDKDFGNLKLVQTIYDIRSMLKALSSTSIIYMPRYSNFLADSLAKRGCSLDGGIVDWCE
ncbi:hypothetical protein Ddye_018104 [Dipteronia dyeriana]|uniref:RNase H type-1 domain-containing protein n=1 Tax=Dipteronia dyeriana TaxID=168575 RepID=A0AAD9U9X3_9ROSI|nr:hypothetical protein Ddye_018104 [Dipteronia dyeriana]